MTISLGKFIEKYGKELGEKIEKELTPLYNPMKDDSNLNPLNRTPFPVQEQIIKGLAKALYQENRKKVFVCGEMGTGKTFLGLAVISMSPKPMRSLIVCPGHLVEKWIREAKATIPNIKVYDLAVKNVITILDKLRQEKAPLKVHEIWVISKERAKLSYRWGPAYNISKISGYPKCPACGETPKDKDDEILTISTLQKKRCTCQCNNPLWQALPKIRRYSPAEYIKKYLKHVFEMVILDEIHDYKAGDTLQGHTMGQLVASSTYFLGLTGTLNGGYADNLFYLLYRLAPQSLKEFGYHGVEKWQRAYGVIEEVRKLEEEDHAYGRIKRNNIIVKKRPGVSPEVIGKYFLDKSCFIRLADVIDGLPPYDEIVTAVEMNAEQRGAYIELESLLRTAVQRYRMKATAPMLQALLSYPDSCTAYPECIEIKNTPVLITADKLSSKLLPKEKELLNIVEEEKRQNRKVLIYLTFTGTRDIRQRIKEVLESKKLKVGILPETIVPKKREHWIEQNSYKFDTLITNPELVKVGLDLMEFPTIIFYQTGYNTFTLRQAARRSWRIGQTRPVRVHYLTYKNTMQETALTLIAKKLEIALMVEGDLPEGLAEYQVEGGSLVEEMAKALIEGRQYNGAETAWASFRKKEIESSLGITKKETIFTEQPVIKRRRPKIKTTVTDNTVIKISIFESKKKKVSNLSVRYGELDTVLEGKTVQFALF